MGDPATISIFYLLHDVADKFDISQVGRKKKFPVPELKIKLHFATC